ncbi:MAG: winged helix-turn-helix transcriptional regulator [Actinocrinis sp.]
MLGRLYEGQVCSAARTLELVGERWSLLIVRNAMFAGMTRFTEFQRSLGIAPNILAKRLAEFVEAGLFEQRGAGEGGHAEYVLTKKGLDLQPVIIALTEWGDRYAAPDGRPIAYEHEGCDGSVVLKVECAKCGESPTRTGVKARLAHKFQHARYGWTAPSHT